MVRRLFPNRGVSRFVAIALLSLGLTLGLAIAPASPIAGMRHPWSAPFTLQPASAQWRGTSEPAAQIYEQMPELPLANDYLNVETGDRNPDNTFANRFIRYHLYVQRRSPVYRMDWKITLADYLGLNAWMRENQYPGYDVLRTNPLNGDREIVQGLSRAQRDELVQTLVDIFNAAAASNPGAPPTDFSSPAAPAPTPSSPRVITEPGAADLLLP